MEDKIRAVLEACERLPFNEKGYYFVSKDCWIRVVRGSVTVYEGFVLGNIYTISENCWESVAEILYSLLSLGVKPDEKDENGLLPCPQSLFRLTDSILEALKKAMTMQIKPSEVDWGLLRESWDDLIERAWNTRAHAPIHDGLLTQIRQWLSDARDEADRNKAIVLPYSRLADLQKILDSAPIAGKDPKPLIEALESIGRTAKTENMDDDSGVWGNVEKRCISALAAYREGGEG